jgi:hypothetical protein
MALGQATLSPMCLSAHLQCRSIDLQLPLTPHSCTVPTLPRTAPIEEFRRFWVQGIPVVVTGVQSHLQGDWTPDYFIERYGTAKVTLVDCETEGAQQSTVAEFFRNFSAVGGRGQILKLKVTHSSP